MVHQMNFTTIVLAEAESTSTMKRKERRATEDEHLMAMFQNSGIQIEEEGALVSLLGCSGLLYLLSLGPYQMESPSLRWRRCSSC